jgi:hypothetical protein
VKSGGVASNGVARRHYSGTKRLGLQVATKRHKGAQAATRELRPVILRVRVTERLHEELARLAIEEHRTLSAMAELLLKRAIEERRKR